MKYLIVPCKADLDSVASMYLYYQFILIAGFEVECYIDKKLDAEIDNLLKKLKIKFKHTNKIDSKFNIIILNNKFESYKDIDKTMVTEIISLEDGNFDEFTDANIKIENVALLTTIMIERYRKYNVKLPLEVVSLLIETYKINESVLTDRDKLAIDYIKLLYTE